MSDITYRDEIVVYRALTADLGARDFLEELKSEMKTSFDQEEILIVEREVDTL